MAKIKRIAIITRDCAGINAAIRAVVRTATTHNIEVVGVMRGFLGLIEGETKTLNHRSVSGIINLGGTILKTARAAEFPTRSGQLKALQTIRDNNIDALIVLGGNGSLSAAHLLSVKHGIQVVGIPATIDNDINGVNMAIGTDTALNVALDALDKIRDTATSLERIFLVEVMGRECGYIASRVALAGGCEEVVLPEKKFNLKTICEEIMRGHQRGKITWIIVVAEGKMKAHVLGKKITDITGFETREVVLGHIQRGGSPTAFDRILAARYGNFAVETLRQGKTDVCVATYNAKMTLIPLAKAIRKKDVEVNSYYRLIKILT